MEFPICCFFRFKPHALYCLNFHVWSILMQKKTSQLKDLSHIVLLARHLNSRWFISFFSFVPCPPQGSPQVHKQPCFWPKVRCSLKSDYLEIQWYTHSSITSSKYWVSPCQDHGLRLNYFSSNLHQSINNLTILFYAYYIKKK